MDRSGEEIKPSQYMLLIPGFLSGSLLILAFFSNLAKQDSWIIVLFSVPIILPFLALYVYVSKKFPGKSLIEIHEIVYGKVAGRIISALYVFFFLSLLSFNIRDMSVFYTSAIMLETPPVVFMVATTALCAYAVKKDIKVIARVSAAVFILLMIALFFTVVLLLGDLRFDNILPIFELPADKFVQALVIMSFVPFGEIILFLMVTPYIKDYKKLGRYSLGGLCIAALVYLLVIIRNTTVLGAAGNYFALPSYQSVQMINIGEFLNRVELFIALNQTASLFIKISILYFATVNALNQIMRLKSKRAIVIPIGAIAVIYALVAHPSEVDHAEWGAKHAAFFELPFVAVLPLFTLMIIIIRKLPRKKELLK